MRDWRKLTITTMKKTKKANRGLKARWPELEERVHRWVVLPLHAAQPPLYQSLDKGVSETASRIQS